MSSYALGTIEDKRRSELVRLCRQHSAEGLQKLTARIGTGEVMVEWSSRPTTGIEDKKSRIASIEHAVAAFEELGVSLIYFYRLLPDQEWEKVDRHVFKNLLRSDLQTWHEIQKNPD